MITPFFRSPDRAFTLLRGDCVELLKQFEFKFDMIFADPPYFLSNGGISMHRLPRQTEEGRHHLGERNVSQHLLRSQPPDGAGIQNSECRHMGQDQSASQHFVPLFHPFSRVYRLGKEVGQGAPLLQLRADEAHQRR